MQLLVIHLILEKISWIVIEANATWKDFEKTQKKHVTKITNYEKKKIWYH